MSDGISITRVESFDGQPVVYRPNDGVEVFGTFSRLSDDERQQYADVVAALRSDTPRESILAIGGIYSQPELADELIAQAEQVLPNADQAIAEGGWLIVDEAKTDEGTVFTGLLLGLLVPTEDGEGLKTAVLASEVDPDVAE